MNAQSPDRLIVTSSPHITGSRTTHSIMLDVIIALMPTAIASTIIFGWRSAWVIAVCIVSCVLFEALWCLAFRKDMMIKDFSAVVTGILLAYNLPASIPIWQAVFGCLVAIIVVKQLFGGIGCNFVNPALAARVVLALSFTANMTTYSYPIGVDVLSSATPLSQLGGNPVSVPSFLSLLIGNHGGVLGETSTLALLLGGLYLVLRGVISPIIPVTYIGSTILISWLGGTPYPLHAALSGGLILGAVYMATDYTTSPYTNFGRLVFGISCGVLTALIRTFGSSTEGVSYALLLMNILLPYVNDLARRKPLGTGEKKKNE